MKKILTLITLLVSLTAYSQVYDGITQPTKYRLIVPVTFENQPVVSPLFGYKYQPLKSFSITPVVQYNLNTETFIPQVWLNYNIKERFYVLSRSILNTKTKQYSHTLSATAKLDYGFMIDATWQNMYNGKFADGDRLQFLGGIAHKKIVFNAGYSVRSHKGFITNLRYKVTDWNWLQVKYDGGLNLFSFQTVLQM